MYHNKNKVTRGRGSKNALLMQILFVNPHFCKHHFLDTFAYFYPLTTSMQICSYFDNENWQDLTNRVTLDWSALLPGCGLATFFFLILVADRSILGDVNAELSVRVQPPPSMLSKGPSTPGTLSDTGMPTLQRKPKHAQSSLVNYTLNNSREIKHPHLVSILGGLWWYVRLKIYHGWSHQPVLMLLTST